MKKILRQLLMTNLKKTYLKVKVYLTLQIKFQTLINLKKNKKKNSLINIIKEKHLKIYKLAEIIKVPKKRKVQRDKLAQIAANKIKKKYKNIRFR